MNHLKRLRGFTLIELLAVIAIIGILATLAAFGINNASRRGRDAKRKSDMSSIKQALEIYYQDVGSFPANGGATGMNVNANFIIPATGNVLTANSAYLTSIPQDPKSGQGTFGYRYNSNGTGYVLQSILENNADPVTITASACSTGGTAPGLTPKGNGVAAQTATTTPRCFRLTSD